MGYYKLTLRYPKRLDLDPNIVHIWRPELITRRPSCSEILAMARQYGIGSEATHKRIKDHLPCFLENKEFSGSVKGDLDRKETTVPTQFEIGTNASTLYKETNEWTKKNNLGENGYLPSISRYLILWTAEMLKEQNIGNGYRDHFKIRFTEDTRIRKRNPVLEEIVEVGLR